LGGVATGSIKAPDEDIATTAAKAEGLRFVPFAKLYAIGTRTLATAVFEANSVKAKTKTAQVPAKNKFGNPSKI
jgi:hypothetical protein